MGSWNTLLAYENEIKSEIEFLSNNPEDQPTLFQEASFNPGGQQAFMDLMKWNSLEALEHRVGLMCGGIGSGKSWAGAIYACAKSLLDPTSRGLIVANTYGQLSRASLITLVEVCRQFKIPLEPYRPDVEDQALAIANCQRCYIGKERAFIYVLSMNSFMGTTQAARGLQIRWFWGDELAYTSEKAFNVMLGRLGRGVGIIKGQGIITSSPAGFNYLYELFANPTRDEKTKQLYKMVQVSTKENVKNLGEEYIELLESSYKDELGLQELEGQFINTLEGVVYKYFDRRVHCLREEDAKILEYDNNLPLYLTFDFNYSPAICLAAQHRLDEIHFFKEWFILDSDMWELGDEVTTWILDNGIPPQIKLFGDATGRARTANSRLSSWDIITESLKDITKYQHPGYLSKKFAKSNPNVINRIHSVNLLLMQNRCFIDYENCPKLVNDFEQVVYSPDNSIAKENPLLSHLSDAAGYLIHSIYPFKREGYQQRLGKKKPKGVAT